MKPYYLPWSCPDPVSGAPTIHRGMGRLAFLPRGPADIKVMERRLAERMGVAWATVLGWSPMSTAGGDRPFAVH